MDRTEPSTGLFAPTFTSPQVDQETDDRAWLRAMLDAERALATAGAKAGVIPAEAAEAIAAACDPSRFDLAAIGQRAAVSATPVIPLVHDLTEAVPDHAKPFVHHGATSQDIVDTAAMLVAHRALGPIQADLTAAATAAARLAQTHKTTVMAGRTMLQHAFPTTFGLACAGWLVALDDARTGLTEVRRNRLAAQLGGAVGTLAAFDNKGAEVLSRFSDELGLAEPVLPWHTDRSRVADLAGALGATAGVLAKVARDVILLASTELGEVAEGGPGGGSSAMPHKRNPVHAVVISADAHRVPGLVATILAGMAQEHQRAAGAWQAEWGTLTELLRLTGGAAAHGRTLLDGLRVDPQRMRSNLDLTGQAIMSAAVADRLSPALGRTAAHDLVNRAVKRAAERGVTLRAALADDPAVPDTLADTALDEALDPGHSLGSAVTFVDRALIAHRALTADLTDRPGEENGEPWTTLST
jgi:3-carboxy-cis,cis-muconate cycloisomerase